MATPKPKALPWAETGIDYWERPTKLAFSATAATSTLGVLYIAHPDGGQTLCNPPTVEKIT